MRAFTPAQSRARIRNETNTRDSLTHASALMTRHIQTHPHSPTRSQMLLHARPHKHRTHTQTRARMHACCTSVHTVLLYRCIVICWHACTRYCAHAYARTNNNDAAFICLPAHLHKRLRIRACVHAQTVTQGEPQYSYACACRPSTWKAASGREHARVRMRTRATLGMHICSCAYQMPATRCQMPGRLGRLRHISSSMPYPHALWSALHKHLPAFVHILAFVRVIAYIHAY